jgi:hypothetical protein
MVVNMPDTVSIMHTAWLGPPNTWLQFSALGLVYNSPTPHIWIILQCLLGVFWLAIQTTVSQDS